MSTVPVSVQVSIKNTSNKQALIQLYHQSASGTNNHGGGWIVAAGATVSAFSVSVDTRYANSWRVIFSTFGDSTSSVYDSNWCNALLTTDTSITLKVSDTQLVIDVAVGIVNANMNRTGDFKHTTNVFVLMLENHSFDNIFAKSGISGLTVATTSNKNSYGGSNYAVSSPAPYSLDTDPAHEFLDVVQQLTGQLPGAWTDGQKYPTINNAGFVANYATSDDEDTGLPGTTHLADVMKCFDTPSQLPVILKLANEYAICDHWFSSMPGPTWPNRYFAHAASSANLDDSPPGYDAGFMQYLDGMSFDNGTLYDKIHSANLRYRLYNDDHNRFADSNPGTSTIKGSYAQVSSLEGISVGDVNDLTQFASDLQLPYPYVYTFIEPNYGDVDDDTFANGSSQHPMDGMGGGEGLIKYVYETLRNSPIWLTSVLIITYDEHGGYYDSVKPGSATPPGDSYTVNWYNEHGFKFDVYGARVPAVIISPLIKKGTVDHGIYDHSSIARTISDMFGTAHLTDRDQAAKSLKPLLTLTFGNKTVRTNCVTTLPNPVRPLSNNISETEHATRLERVRTRPLPTRGNIHGFLQIMAKTEYEIRGKSASAAAEILERVKSIKTFGDVQNYSRYVKSLRADWRAARAAKSVPEA